MKKILLRWKIEWTDAIRWNRLFRILVGYARWIASYFALSTSTRLQRLTLAYRCLIISDREEPVAHRLKPWVLNPAKSGIWLKEVIEWQHYLNQTTKGTINRGVILKPRISDKEKGVLFLSFEYNLLVLTRAASDLKKTLKDYTIICTTSWSPPHLQTLWAGASLQDADIYYTISNEKDTEWIKRLHPGIRMLPYYRSHWVHPDFYKPKPHSERTIDILMVANWAPFKRHWLLFKALRKMPPELRVVLIGQNQDRRTHDDVYRDAALYGVENRIEIMHDLKIEEVADFQCDSKVSIVCSAREGSCVSIAQSLMADSPTALMEGCHIGSASFINAETGQFLNKNTMAEQITQMVQNSSSYSARKWAETEIASPISISKMNEDLKRDALANGRDWTTDILPFSVFPDPQYDDRQKYKEMLPVARNLAKDHGLHLLQHLRDKH